MLSAKMARKDAAAIAHSVRFFSAPDAPGLLHDDGGDRRLDAVEQSGHQRHVAEGDVHPGQRDQDEQRRQHEQRAGNDAAPASMHQPADIGRELLRLRARQHHAVVQRVQEAALGNPAPVLDQFLMHDRNLAGRSAKTDETQLEPEHEGFAEWNAGGSGGGHRQQEGGRGMSIRCAFCTANAALR